MVTGVVSKITGANRAGRQVYSIQVNGQYYGGFWNTAPNCNEGDTVEFDATQNGQYWNANPNSLRKVAGGAPAPDTSVAAAAPRANNGGDARQNSIVYQSSRKDAIQIVDVLLRSESLTLPTKKADRMSVVLDLVDELTEDLAYKAVSPEILSPDERLQREVMDEVSSDVDE